jgi:hypothetical protein
MIMGGSTGELSTSNKANSLDISDIGGNSFFNGVKKGVIVTNGDKVKLCLIEFRDALKGQTDWLGQIGLILSLLLALIASDFKEFWLFTSGRIEGIFVTFLIISIVKLILTAYHAYKNKDAIDLDNVVKHLKEISSDNEYNS